MKLSDKNTFTPNCHALPANTCLNGKYKTSHILGTGGFAITYGGCHMETKTPVAIKEYFPHRIALRTQENGAFHVSPFPEKYTEEFEEGLRHFLNEAKILKELKHLDSIVSVYDYFEENGTVYIVMEYIEGLTLSQFIKENGVLSFPELLVLITPVILSLSEIHKKGLIHRDISPDNLILGTDSRLHLIDFGAAKKNTAPSNNNTIILKAGYAPAEQYIPNGKIGSWTDVYSLCATMYFSLTGQPPKEAIWRLDSDGSIDLDALTMLTPDQRKALEQGLQLRPANRLANMQELYNALTLPSSPEQTETVQITSPSGASVRKIHRMLSGRKKRYFLLLPLLGLLLVFLVKELVYDRSEPLNPAASLPASTVPAQGTASGGKKEPTVQETLLSMVNVTGMKLKTARKAIRKLDSDIRIETIYANSNTTPSGYVIHQSVTKNTVFTRGNLPSVLLTVSKGKKQKKANAPKEPEQPKTPQNHTETPVPAKTNAPANTSAPAKTNTPANTSAPAKTNTPSKEKGSPNDRQKGKEYQVVPNDDYTDFSLD